MGKLDNLINQILSGEPLDTAEPVQDAAPTTPIKAGPTKPMGPPAALPEALPTLQEMRAAQAEAPSGPPAETPSDLPASEDDALKATRPVTPLAATVPAKGPQTTPLTPLDQDLTKLVPPTQATRLVTKTSTPRSGMTTQQRLSSRRPDSAFFNKIKKVPYFEFDQSILAVSLRQKSIAERYRMLRTNLMSVHKTTGAKLIGVTSCQSQEGKTTTTINLTRFMANFHDVRVCLVDCDLRIPLVKNYLNLNIKYGLDDVIEGRCELHEAMVHSLKDNLTVLPARKGHSMATEILDSLRMNQVLQTLREEFDFVIFDTCPVLATTDPLVLGSKIDGLIMVVRARQIMREQLQNVIEMIGQVDIPVFGLVLTHFKEEVPKFLSRFTYYAGYYSYSRYYETAGDDEDLGTPYPGVHAPEDFEDPLED